MKSILDNQSRPRPAAPSPSYLPALLEALVTIRVHLGPPKDQTHLTAVPAGLKPELDPCGFAPPPPRAPR